ncbi:MFS transporter [Deferribacterales bacterium RsTz2092]|nr:MFS transporter [Deferribacterales bacterium]
MKIIPKEVEPPSQRMFVFLALTMLASYLSFQGWQMLITNFAVEDVHFNGLQMGITQSVREIPGLLCFFAVIMLAFVREYRLANIFIFCLGIGVFFTGFFPYFHGILITAFIMSCGFHFYDTLSQSMVLQYFGQKSAPLVLGSLRGLAATSSISVAVLVLILLTIFPEYMNYKRLLMIIGSGTIIIGLVCLFLRPARTDLPIQTRKIRFKREYWLYYLLTGLAGGRRQIYFSFATYLLVSRFHFSAVQIVALFLLNNIINFVMNPLIGRLVGMFGERKIMTFEYSSAIIIFSLYAFNTIPAVAAAAYVLDQFCMNMQIAERTFFQKIAYPEDIATGTAMGFGIMHIAAVSIPIIGGMLWLVNYKIAFFAGLAIAATNLTFAQLIDREKAKAQVRLAARQEVAVA